MWLDAEIICRDNVYGIRCAVRDHRMNNGQISFFHSTNSG